MTPPERLQDVTLAERLRDALRVLADYPLEDFSKEGKPDGHGLFGANDWKLTVGHVKAARSVIAEYEAAAALSGEVVAWLEPGTLNSASPTDFAGAVAKWPADYADWFPVFTAPQAVVPQWQPIETAPKDGTRIILGRPDIDGDGGVSAHGWWDDALDDGVDYMGHDGGFTDSAYQVFNPGRSFGNPDYRHIGSQPTHWQPLPTPPSEG